MRRSVNRGQEISDDLNRADSFYVHTQPQCGEAAIKEQDDRPAEPLLSGFASYLGKLGGGLRRSADPSRLLWIWEDDSKDPWRTGDLMADEFIAWAYVTYLDTHFERQTSPTASSLVCS